MLSITHGGTTGQSFRLMTHPIKVKAVHKQILKSFKAEDEFTFKKKKISVKKSRGGESVTGNIGQWLQPGNENKEIILLSTTRFVTNFLPATQQVI